MLRITILTTLPILMLGTSAATQEVTRVPVETFELSNGMKFLAVSRPELTTVSAGWVAHVGSSNERPGITGISHFFEHMMFKGTVKLRLTAVPDAQHGGLTTDSSPVSWGSVS